MGRARIRDLDFVAARERLIGRVDRASRLVRDRRGEIHFDRTKAIREVDGAAGATLCVERALVRALEQLPVAEGGAVRASHLTADRPLVAALLILGSHPRYDGFGAVDLRDRRVGRALARLHAASQPAWSLAALERTVVDALCSVYGEVEVDAEATAHEIAPGSQVGCYFDVLGYSGLFDAIGAFDPGFTRRDALAGDWWLIQPVSPRLDHRALAFRLGLELAGYLPPTHVDAPGRVVMACYERRSEPRRGEELEESTFVAGWRRAIWTPGAAPLDAPAFELVPRLAGITEASYGPYRHSSELPPYSDAAELAERGRTIAEALLAGMDQPDSPERAAWEARKEQEDREALERFYVETGQRPPKR